MDKSHVYMCLHIELIKSNAGNKTRFFLSPFLAFIGRFLILAEAFRNDYVAAYSTALRSATEENELGGCVTIPFKNVWYVLKVSPLVNSAFFKLKDKQNLVSWCVT